MDREKLREIVLVKAIETADRAGVVISHIERNKATQSTRTANGLPATGTITDISEDTLAKTLADRAAELLRPVQSRYPVFEDVIEASRCPSALIYLVVPLGLLSGFGIRWTSDWDRLNLMNVPVAGLIIWNVAVYLSIAVSALLGRSRRNRTGTFWAIRAARFVSTRLSQLESNTTKVNPILGHAIADFVRDWSVIGSGLLGHQLRRLLHTGAACVGLGLISGFYVHAFDHDFYAGWRSGYEAPTVKRVIDASIGQFAFAVKVQYPKTLDDVKALEFRNDAYVKTRGLPWVHLISLLVLTTVVLPRLILAGWSTLLIRADRRRPGIPKALLSYAGSVLGVPTYGAKSPVSIFPYDYSTPPVPTQRLEGLISREFGSSAEPRIEQTIPRGHEAQISEAMTVASQSAVGLAIICPLRKMPRAKYHGVLLSKAHDRHLSPALGMALKLIVDEEWPKPKAIPAWVHARRVSSHKHAWEKMAKQSRVEICFLA